MNIIVVITVVITIPLGHCLLVQLQGSFCMHLGNRPGPLGLAPLLPTPVPQLPHVLRHRYSIKY